MGQYRNYIEINTLYELMPYKVREILLVSNIYDAFILEKNGQLTEKIFHDYSEHNLFFAPRITRVSSRVEMADILKKRHFDLVITMMDLNDANAFELAKEVKEHDKDLPVVLLMSDPSTVDSILMEQKSDILDGVFLWSGNTNIFFAIIKLIEDKKNLDPDLESTGFIKLILLIEDSVEYYSRFLHPLYHELMDQTKLTIKDGLDDYHKVKCMKTRPKIILCHSYEEAIEIHKKYAKHMLGVISDTCIIKNGERDKTAGLDFLKILNKSEGFVPSILMSTESSNKQAAQKEGLMFADKNSRDFIGQVRDFLHEHMGFGEFKFRDSEGNIIGTAADLNEFQKMIETLPDDSLLHHGLRNDFSLWLTARGDHEAAFFIRPVKVSDLASNPKSIRHYLTTSIKRYREEKQRGLVVSYKEGDWVARFTQIGDGPLGGKGRGIAFANYLLESSKIKSKFREIRLRVPYTIAISTDEFDKFMKSNKLNSFIYEDDENVIVDAFIKAEFSPKMKRALEDVSKHFKKPLAVRSSSLLEDSQFLPFAGIYSTYMLPNNESDSKRLDDIERAIKLVYASTFSKQSKAYFNNSPFNIEDEKMGIVIQEIVGSAHENFYFPNFSGVAQSYNFYPVSHMKSSDGVAQIAVGLGKTVVDGGQALRFCPKYPDLIPQFASVESTLQTAQKKAYVLKLDSKFKNSFITEDDTLTQLSMRQLAKFGVLDDLAGVYDVNDNSIKQDLSLKGPKVVNFDNILKYEKIPLSKVLEDLMKVLSISMAKEVEIEFAVDMTESAKPTFYILQIRPLVIKKEEIKFKDDDLKKVNQLSYCAKAMGNGIVDDISNIIFVKRDRFDSAKTDQIAKEIGEFNEKFKKSGQKYLLVTIGRLGTSDPWVGIPVSWDQISNVGAIVETETKNFYADPSQGSHFFQNITSRSIPYFSVNPKGNDDFVDWEYLEGVKASGHSEYVMSLSFSSPIEVKVNGKTGEGIIKKGKS